MRLAVAGSPRSGKTTYCKQFESVKHTDDFLLLGWSEASEEASKWFDEGSDYVIEGVAVSRALRKWLKRNMNNKNKPVEKILYFHKPLIPLSCGQDRMRKGELTVWEEIKDNLKQRGIYNRRNVGILYGRQRKK